MWKVSLLLLLALIPGRGLSSQDRAELDKQISQALDKARPLLLDRLPELQQGRLALACHALLNDGVTMREPRFAKALQRLAKARLFRCYALSLRLMVIQELRDYPHRLQAAKEDCARLLRHQARSGGFTYTPDFREADMSNTQYAALGLRAAANLRAPISSKQWSKLAAYALHRQQRGGGVLYSRKSRDVRASMVVALIAILEICKPHLPSRSSLGRRSEKAIQAAWGWMEKNSSSIGKGRAASMGSYYYHYGLERAAVLSEVFDVGKVDWYRAGAGMMLRQQAEGGGWNGIDIRRAEPDPAATGPVIDDIQTSFAILFLRRRFQRTLGTVVTSGKYIRPLYLPEKATAKQITASAKGAVARGYKAVPELIKALRSSYLSRRRAAALALIQITGRFEDLSPYVRPEDNAEALHDIEAWWMREGRKKLDR